MSEVPLHYAGELNVMFRPVSSFDFPRESAAFGGIAHEWLSLTSPGKCTMWYFRVRATHRAAPFKKRGRRSAPGAKKLNSQMLSWC